MNSLRNINQIVGDCRSLRRMLDNIQQQHTLSRLVLQSMPKNYANHCQFVITKGNSLILYVDSPVWSSRFRYIGPSLLSTLKNNNMNYQQLTVVKVKTLNVIPTAEHFTKNTRRLPTISLENIQQLEQIAAGKPPALRKSLLKLAATLKKKAQNGD